MPFAPLPTNFLNLLDNLSDAGLTVLELGCGEGNFSQLINRPGINLFGLDYSFLAGNNDLHLVGNALCPPIQTDSVDLILAANLVRHLLPKDPSGNFLEKWQSLLKPGGSLVIFEDEPGSEPLAVRNYQEVQLFLAQLVGPCRGPLLPLKKFQKLVSGKANHGPWKVKLEKNSLVADDKAVLSFLAGSSGEVSPDVSRLMDSIEENGLSYGQYWWAQWERVV